MRTVGTLEAKTHLSELLDAVEEGEEVIITRHGKAVARLHAVAVPPVASELKTSGIPLLPGETIREFIHAGHKY